MVTKSQIAHKCIKVPYIANTAFFLHIFVVHVAILREVYCKL